MAYCPACGAQASAEDRFCSECGRELPAPATTPTPSPPPPEQSATLAAAPRPEGPSTTSEARGSKRRWFIVAGVVFAAALILGLVLITGGGSDETKGHERVCELTHEFWSVVDGDEGRTELDRLMGIARRMGDGIDDQAEEEGFDDIAENATEAAIGASFADATGDTDAMFRAVENLQSLCDDLGLQASAAPPSSAQSRQSNDEDAAVDVTPADHPAGTAIARESSEKLPDDPFESINCNFPGREIEGAGTAYYCLGTQRSGRSLEVHALDDGTEITWGFSVGGPDCEGVSGCTYSNAVDLIALRSQVASVAGASPDDVDCDVGYWPAHRVPPGGRIKCEARGQTVEAKVTADDEYELVR